MNAETGVIARKAAEEHIKKPKKSESLWNTAPEDILQSKVGCVRIYGDKSRASHKTGDLTFYPLHITLPSFSERIRRLQFLSDTTTSEISLTGFIPASVIQYWANRDQGLINAWQRYVHCINVLEFGWILLLKQHNADMHAELRAVPVFFSILRWHFMSPIIPNPSTSYKLKEVAK